jgi:hypothetical protein
VLLQQLYQVDQTCLDELELQAADSRASGASDASLSASVGPCPALAADSAAAEEASVGGGGGGVASGSDAASTASGQMPRSAAHWGVAAAKSRFARGAAAEQSAGAAPPQPPPPHHRRVSSSQLAQWRLSSDSSVSTTASLDAGAACAAAAAPPPPAGSGASSPRGNRQQQRLEAPVVPRLRLSQLQRRSLRASVEADVADNFMTARSAWGETTPTAAQAGAGGLGQGADWDSFSAVSATGSQRASPREAAGSRGEAGAGARGLAASSSTSRAGALRQAGPAPSCGAGEAEMQPDDPARQQHQRRARSHQHMDPHQPQHDSADASPSRQAADASPGKSSTGKSSSKWTKLAAAVNASPPAAPLHAGQQPSAAAGPSAPAARGHLDDASPRRQDQTRPKSGSATSLPRSQPQPPQQQQLAQVPAVPPPRQQHHQQQQQHRRHSPAPQIASSRYAAVSESGGSSAAVHSASEAMMQQLHLQQQQEAASLDPWSPLRSMRGGGASPYTTAAEIFMPLHSKLGSLPSSGGAGSAVRGGKTQPRTGAASASTAAASASAAAGPVAVAPAVDAELEGACRNLLAAMQAAEAEAGGRGLLGAAGSGREEGEGRGAAWAAAAVQLPLAAVAAAAAAQRNWSPDTEMTAADLVHADSLSPARSTAGSAARRPGGSCPAAAQLPEPPLLHGQGAAGALTDPARSPTPCLLYAPDRGWQQQQAASGRPLSAGAQPRDRSPALSARGGLPPRSPADSSRNATPSHPTPPGTAAAGSGADGGAGPLSRNLAGRPCVDVTAEAVSPLTAARERLQAQTHSNSAAGAGPGSWAVGAGEDSSSLVMQPEQQPAHSHQQQPQPARAQSCAGAPLEGSVAQRSRQLLQTPLAGGPAAGGGSSGGRHRRVRSDLPAYYALEPQSSPLRTALADAPAEPGRGSREVGWVGFPGGGGAVAACGCRTKQRV